MLKNFTKIWIDADKYPETKFKYGVRVYPTLIIIKDGKEVTRMMGGTDARSLTIILEDLLRRYKDV